MSIYDGRYAVSSVDSVLVDPSENGNKTADHSIILRVCHQVKYHGEADESYLLTPGMARSIIHLLQKSLTELSKRRGE